MFRFVTPLLALCLLAAPVAAQQQNQNPSAQNVERTKHGDWTVECRTLQNGGRFCQMGQNLNNPSTNKPLMQVVVGIKRNDTQSQPFLQVLAPLGIWLRPGLEFSIDGGQPTRLAFETCLKVACVAEMALSEGLLSAMKRGAKATVVMRNIRREKLEVPVSLSGFTASYNAL